MNRTKARGKETNGTSMCLHLLEATFCSFKKMKLQKVGEQTYGGTVPLDIQPAVCQSCGYLAVNDTARLLQMQKMTAQDEEDSSAQ